MLVTVVAGLLEENQLIYARRFELLEILAHLVRCPDPSGATMRKRSSLFECLPQVQPSRHMRSKPIEVCEPEREELRSFDSSGTCLLRAPITHEIRQHGDIWIDCPSDRTALALERLVVLVDPVLCVPCVHEGERERAHAEPRSHLHRL